MIDTRWSGQLKHGPGNCYIFDSTQTLSALAWSGWSKQSNQYLELVKCNITDAALSSGTRAAVIGSEMPGLLGLLGPTLFHARLSATEAIALVGPPLDHPGPTVLRKRSISCCASRRRPCGVREQVPSATSAVMSCMLPTATLRCACCAVFILPNITASLSRESVAQASVQGGIPPCTGTTKLSRCGSAYQAPPLDLVREVVVSVSGESGVPLSPGSTMSRLAGASPPTASLRGLEAAKWQRGHVGPPVAALGDNPTSPLYPVRCSVASVSGQGGLPPCPGTTRLSRGVHGSCGARPLRQSYITPHCPQCQPVSRKLLLCPAPHRALRVKATGVMQNCLRWIRSHSRRRSPVAFAPYAPPPGTLVVVVAPWHRSGAARGVSGQWPPASRVVCAPPTLGASPLRGIGPARSARPPPRGSLSPRGCPNASLSSLLTLKDHHHA